MASPVQLPTPQFDPKAKQNTPRTMILNRQDPRRRWADLHKLEQDERRPAPHSAVVMSGCDSTGSPGMFRRYWRKVRADLSLASAARCSRSSTRRKCGLMAATGLHRMTSSKSTQRSESACNSATCRPSPLPCLTKSGHQLPGPVKGCRCERSHDNNLGSALA